MASISRWRASATSRRFFSSTSTAVSRKSRSASAMRPISSRPAAGSGARRLPPAMASMLWLTRSQTGEKVAVDVEPDDQNRTQEAEKGRAKDNSGAVALDDRGFASGRGDLVVCRGDQAIDGSGEIARQLIVFGQKLLALRQDRKLVLARLQDAVLAVDQRLELVDPLLEPGSQLSSISAEIVSRAASERRSGNRISARSPGVGASAVLTRASLTPQSPAAPSAAGCRRRSPGPGPQSPPRVVLARATCRR